MSIEETEKESAANATAPRVSLRDIEAAIKHRYDINAFDAVEASIGGAVEELELLSMCLLIMTNGFVVVGKSAPASPANFNQELGTKFAYEDAIRQLWPLMGFALRDKLSNG